MQGKIRALAASGALALGVLAATAGPALASGTPQPCSDNTHCSGNINATVTVNTELTLTLSTPSLSLSSVIAGVGGTASTGPAAEVAGVSSYDPSGYSLGLVSTSPGCPSACAFTGTANPSNTIPLWDMSVLQGASSTTYPSGTPNEGLGNVPGNWTGGTGCAHAGAANGNPAGSGCTEDAVNFADDWSFGFSLAISPSQAIPDTYSAPFTVNAIGM